MERALRYFAIAFFFSFPAVFFPPDWPLPIFPFPFSSPFGVSYYEGAKIAYLAFFAVAFSLGTLALKYREIGFSRFSRQALFPLSAFALFWWSSWANPGFPFADAVSGRTYSTLPFLALFSIACALSAYDSSFRRNSAMALVFGFVLTNFPYAVLQVFGLDPFSATAILPWEAGRAF